MRLRRALLAAAVLAALLPAPRYAAAGNDAAPALALVRRAYSAITGLTADFTQTEERPNVGVSHREDGRLYFSPPGRMRWDYRGETPHKVVINGSLVWIYTPSRDQVIRREMTPEELRNGPATFLSGLDGLEEDFIVRPGAAGSGGDYELDLLPRTEDTSFEKVSMTVAAQTGLVERISIFHRLGNITTITFRNFDTGADLDDALYEWDVPGGTEIVEP